MTADHMLPSSSLPRLVMVCAHPCTALLHTSLLRTRETRERCKLQPTLDIAAISKPITFVSHSTRFHCYARVIKTHGTMVYDAKLLNGDRLMPTCQNMIRLAIALAAASRRRFPLFLRAYTTQHQVRSNTQSNLTTVTDQ
ncbi:hypothetical protein M404DRAFT_488200 [Pisolithus tinctorius Marx 270]|uniref:Uncharacterized protein n=1 Tax=Pisolithus tinctorius Marx 270 TaxID=870435 RepID=A0A0C3PDS7_PISTI|nr:hypothetical protein M404DRAFT_488200 [Pisolithus tinctorius Marx 270]